MRRTTAGLLAVLLAAVLLSGLTACGSKEKEAHRINWVTAPAYTAKEIALPVPAGDLVGCCTDGENMYILADEKTGDEVRSVLSRASLADGTVTELEGYEASDPGENVLINRLGPVLAPDGTLWLCEMWTLIYYDLPEDFDPAKEPIGKYYTGQEDFHHLRQLDPVTGRQKKLVDLSDGVRTLDVSDVLDIAGFAVDGRGNVYFAGTGGVAVLDNRGNYLFTLEAALPGAGFNGASGGPLALLPDGTVGALTIQPGGKRLVRNIDVSARGWGSARYELPSGIDQLCSGTGGFLFFYTSGGALWGWAPEAQQGRTLLDWSAADLEGAVMCFALRDGGELAALTLAQNGAFGDEDFWYNTDIRLSMLSPTDKTPENGKIRLVYGCIGTNSVLRGRIDRFNADSDRYYIELRNYAGDGVESFDVGNDGREAARKLLSAEIVSGRVPDIWDTSLPIDLYARKGLLEDLWPYIDGDPEISRDTLMSHVLDCASVDGELYSVFNSFSISTAVARSEAVGSRTSWTLEEVMDYYEDMPEGSTILESYNSRTGVLYDLVSYYIGDWIDWSTGECRFDTEEFKALLEVCGRFNEKVDMENWVDGANGVDLRAGRQLMSSVTLSGAEDILCCEALAGGPQCLMDYGAYLNENNIFATRIDENGEWRDEDVLLCSAFAQMEGDRGRGKLFDFYPLSPDAAFGAVEGGGYAAYPGYPSASGSGSCFCLPDRYGYIDARLGISAACQHKEGAWSYVRQCLLPGGTDPVKAGIRTYIGSGFPMNREDFDRLFEPKWFRREDGEYVLDQDGNRIEEPQGITFVPNHYADVEVSMVIFKLIPNEAQMESFWDLYNAIDKVNTTETAVMKIIDEQAQPYFAGDKSLDEVADLIQRRVSLYVNENR